MDTPNLTDVPMRAVTDVLFLDFDGVLQTPALDDWEEMAHCHGLLALLQAIPELGVVVTSSHREGRNLAGIRRLLPPSIARRVIGSTPLTPGCRAHGGRQAEIEAWLAAHPAVERYAAVDDEARLYAQGCSWLVLTHPLIGWNEDTSESLLVLLGPALRSHPTMTGTRTAPNAWSASQRCLPSMNSSSLPLRTSTGSAGQSARPPESASANQFIWNRSRRPSGKPGAPRRASPVSSLTSIWRIWIGERTRS